jgi:hypothetical protein
MDLYIETNLDRLVKIFESLGFDLTKEERYFCAKLKRPDGRFHAMFAELEDSIYCDFHFDNSLHCLFLGVDYKKRPKALFEKRMRQVFKAKHIRFHIKDVDWFTRRNNAIFSGFRV